MRRRSGFLLGGAALVLAGVGAVVARGSAAPSVPVLEVKPGPFVRRVRAEGNLKAVEAKPLTAPGSDASYKIAWMVEDGTRVKKGDVVVRFSSLEIEKTLATSQADRSTAEQRIGKERAESGAAIRNLTRDAEQARREYETALTFQARDAEIFSRNQIIEAEIDSSLAQKREGHAVTTRSVRESVSTSNVELQGIEVRKADLKIGKAKRDMESLELIAPHDGLVVFQRDWKGDVPQIGQSVWSGFPLAELPDLSKLKAEVFVLEADAGGLTAGRPATVLLESHPDLTFEGKIQKVDTIAKPRVRGVPVQYFGVTVEIAKTDPAVMKPGERVVAQLLLGDEAEVIAVPRQAVFDRRGKKVVYRRQGRGFDAVEVKLGASAVGRVVVTEGLRAGDVIALGDPNAPGSLAGKPAGTGGGPATPAAAKGARS